MPFHVNAMLNLSHSISNIFVIVSSSTDAGLLKILTQRQGGSRRTTVKRKSSKVVSIGKKGREMSASEQLRENIRKYRTEERLLAADPTSFGEDNEECDGQIRGTSLDQSSVPQSPSTEKEAEIKAPEMSLGERWLKLEAEVGVILKCVVSLASEAV